MPFEHLAYDLLRGEEAVSFQTVDLRLPRDVDNSFHLAAGEFQKLLWLTSDLTGDLMSQLDSQFRGSRITATLTNRQVLAAPQFFAICCYQGSDEGISISQSSVSRSIHRATDLHSMT